MKLTHRKLKQAIVTLNDHALSMLTAHDDKEYHRLRYENHGSDEQKMQVSNCQNDIDEALEEAREYILELAEYLGKAE